MSEVALSLYELLVILFVLSSLGLSFFGLWLITALLLIYDAVHQIHSIKYQSSFIRLKMSA